MIHPWEAEYRNPKFITLGTEPISALRDFAKWLRRDQKVDMTDFTVLDLGCGNGKHSVYMVENFCASAIGYDISETAIKQAKELAGDLNCHFSVRSIGKDFPLADYSVDMIIDATSSHVLNVAERGKFLSEISRVIKPGGYYFLRTLAMEGDTNAKKLIQQFPGNEPNTYILPGTEMIERVFTKQDIEHDFAQQFNLLKIEKTAGYQKWGNQNYKRNYWVAYLQKK